MLRSTTIVLALLAVPGLALAAEDRCRITDPTGTPLNLRMDPDGTLLGTIDNGHLVRVTAHAAGARGKPWVLIADLGTGEPFGWVFREYISCF